MTDAECIAFLQWALPKLGRRWAGYRKVRRLVARRLRRRLRALGLANLDAYREWLALHDEEWVALDALLGIPISRFYRDRDMFRSVECYVLPELAEAAQRSGRTRLECWSAGCASGEEPYTLEILWRVRLQPIFPGLTLRIVATDSDSALLERARVGCYRASSLKELPADLRAAAFETRNGLSCVSREHRDVEFRREDLRRKMPAGPFDLVLLRNVVATYYAVETQREILVGVADRIRPGGGLMLGIHEVLPEGFEGLVPWPRARAVFRRSGPNGHESAGSGTNSVSSCTGSFMRPARQSALACSIRAREEETKFHSIKRSPIGSPPSSITTAGATAAKTIGLPGPNTSILPAP